MIQYFIFCVDFVMIFYLSYPCILLTINFSYLRLIIHVYNLVVQKILSTV